jgi:hypothetical protein
MSHIFTIEVTDDEYRAMELILESPEEWANHLIKWNAFKMLLDVTNQTIGDPTLLDQSDLQELQQDLVDVDAVLLDKEDWPIEIHEKITRYTKLKTRVERDAMELVLDTKIIN